MTLGFDSNLGNKLLKLDTFTRAIDMFELILGLATDLAIILLKFDSFSTFQLAKEMFDVFDAFVAFDVLLEFGTRITLLKLDSFDAFFRAMDTLDVMLGFDTDS
jgi:hypothetical protein